jgi:hypothetical protein
MGTGRQIDIVTWFTQPGTRAGLIRAFLSWAGKRHHLPADVGLPPTPGRPPAGPIDSEQAPLEGRTASRHR